MGVTWEEHGSSMGVAILAQDFSSKILARRLYIKGRSKLLFKQHRRAVLATVTSKSARAMAVPGVESAGRKSRKRNARRRQLAKLRHGQ